MPPRWETESAARFQSNSDLGVVETDSGHPPPHSPKHLGALFPAALTAGHDGFDDLDRSIMSRSPRRRHDLDPQRSVAQRAFAPRDALWENPGRIRRSKMPTGFQMGMPFASPLKSTSKSVFTGGAGDGVGWLGALNSSPYVPAQHHLLRSAGMPANCRKNDEWDWIAGSRADRPPAPLSPPLSPLPRTSRGANRETDPKEYRRWQRRARHRPEGGEVARLPGTFRHRSDSGGKPWSEGRFQLQSQLRRGRQRPN